MKATFAVVAVTIFVAFVHCGEAVWCPAHNEDYVTLLPNPDDCKTFYACNNGIAYLMECSPGLEFNPIKKVCDWPEHANCVARLPTTTTDWPVSETTESTDTSPATNPPSTNTESTVSWSTSTGWWGRGK